MSPSAEPTSAPTWTGPMAAVPARLLQGGEEIVLAIKPSPWFVLLVSLPFLASAGGIVLLAWVLDRLAPGWVNLHIISLAGVIGAAVRLVVAVLQWLSRVYILTNLRLLRVKGVLNVEVFECPLTRVQNTYLSLTLVERLFGLGTIWFATAGTGSLEAAWLMIAKPRQVHEIVVQYVQRAQHNHLGGL